MIPVRRAVFAAGVLAGLLSVALPAPSVAQGDSLRVPPRLVDSLRLLDRPLFFEPWFAWVERVSVINMIPQNRSDETNHDAEPNLAVDPTNPSRLVGSAFTPNPTGATDAAPVFVSTDGGTTWALRNIVPSANGMTGDISLDFARRGGVLFTGILRGGAWLRQVVLRSADPFTGGTMTVLTDHDTEEYDQPYVTATTAAVGAVDRDRVYVGFNNYGVRSSAGGTGRTGSGEISLNARTAAPPAHFTTRVVERRTTAEQDMPAVRFAVHDGGVVYGVFYRWVSGTTPNAVCDVIVVRDDGFGAGGDPFAALTDPGDGVPGRIVVAGRTVPAFPASLGQNRLVASNLSITVNPNNAGQVWIAWADRPTGGSYTLHVRRSTDSGATWSADLLTVASATNPALAINRNGVVGFLYQQLTGTAPNQRWHTRLRRTTDGAGWSDLLLADVPNTTGFMGDYLDLIAVGRSFYGVFPALNVPNLANFPQGVAYQRNADFTTNQLRNQANTGNVAASIDPFFFRVTPPLVIDICQLVRCPIVVLDTSRIIIPVDTFPTRVVDPIPRNCLVKWSCPPCPTGLCPPWYHIYLDDLDPVIWSVQVVDQRGDPVRQQVRRLDRGVVLSFRPRPDNFNAREIGDYSLVFETLRPVRPGRHTFGTRLEVDVYPQGEHLRRKPAR